MTFSDQLYHYAISVIRWIDPLIYILGLWIAIWAFRRCGKKAYLVLAFYFGLVLFSLLVLPHIKRAIYEQRHPPMPDPMQAKMDQYILDAIRKFHKKEGYPEIHADLVDKVGINLAPMLLVAGLWLLSKK